LIDRNGLPSGSSGIAGKLALSGMEERLAGIPLKDIAATIRPTDRTQGDPKQDRSTFLVLDSFGQKLRNILEAYMAES
jgi:hypothetical protein